MENQTPVYNPERIVNGVEPEKPKNNFILIILSSLLIVLVLLTGFLTYQNYQLQKQISLLTAITSTPSPTATSDPTANWKTYTNSKYFYEFKCPPTSVHSVELSSGNRNDKPIYQEICSENQDQVRFYVYPLNHAQVASDGASVKEIVSPAGLNKIVLRGFSQTYFDQILSTFKFTEATSSARPTPIVTACTQEAKLCPDGSSVGRTAPNCEFTACPQ